MTTITDLPTELLEMITKFSEPKHIFSIVLINKEFKDLVKDDIKIQKDKYDEKRARKLDFIKRCEEHVGFNTFIGYGMHNLLSYDDCDTLKEMMIQKFGVEETKRRIRNTINYQNILDYNQVQMELLTEYFSDLVVVN